MQADLDVSPTVHKLLFILEKSMCNIKVWGLPLLGEKELATIETEIVRAVSDVKNFGHKNGKDMSVFFPTDQRQHLTDRAILIEIGGLISNLGAHSRLQIRKDLKVKVSAVIIRSFPDRKVLCGVQEFEII